MITKLLAGLAITATLASCLSYNKIADSPKTEVTVAISAGEVAFAGLVALDHDTPGLAGLMGGPAGNPAYGERFVTSLMTIAFADALLAGIAWMIDQDQNKKLH